MFALTNKLTSLGNGITHVWIYIHWYKGKLEFEDLGLKISYNKLGNQTLAKAAKGKRFEIHGDGWKRQSWPVAYFLQSFHNDRHVL